MNTLKNILPDLSRQSGVGVHYTNHSLRATSITRMFNSGLPEKVIAETSGHRSIKALRCYERTSSVQQQAVTASVNKDANSTDMNGTVDNPSAKTSHMATPNFSGNFNNCTINLSLK